MLLITLKVKHVIICGHYNCGGVKAAMQAEDMGILNPWLRNIRDVYRLHKDELNAIEDEQQKYNRLVELNVQEQCVNLIKTAEVQQKALLHNQDYCSWLETCTTYETTSSNSSAILCHFQLASSNKG